MQVIRVCGVYAQKIWYLILKILAKLQNSCIKHVIHLPVIKNTLQNEWMTYRCMITSDETVSALYLSSFPSKISSTSVARNSVMFDANEC